AAVRTPRSARLFRRTEQDLPASPVSSLRRGTSTSGSCRSSLSQARRFIDAVVRRGSQSFQRLLRSPWRGKTLQRRRRIPRRLRLARFAEACDNLPPGMTASFPDWLEPMAATLTQERFTGPEWIFERKFDGIRPLTFKQGTDVRLFSRNRLPQNNPSIVEAIANLPVHDVILDGEVTWRDGTIVYHVFDIMWLAGRDVTSL